jgi:hypothetical protein
MIACVGVFKNRYTKNSVWLCFGFFYNEGVIIAPSTRLAVGVRPS